MEKQLRFPHLQNEGSDPPDSDGSTDRRAPVKGRGAIGNPANRYAEHSSESIEDGWEPQALSPLRTTVTEEKPRRIISRNRSPDIPFDQSINSYRGCEHGCIYCYARPTHAYMDLSPGLDFESRLFVKSGAADLLRAELKARGYIPKVITLGANTDPYQPIERHWLSTRQVLEVLQAFQHPVSITTKGALIERDIDLLSEMAGQRLVQVQISLSTLNREIARTLEPRASAPDRRIETIHRLVEHGIPVTVLLAPVIPALTDFEMETILSAAAKAGASGAGYNLLRLPLELQEMFHEWLEAHQPEKKQRVMNLLKSCHQGQAYRSDFGTRQTGSGHYADMIRQRFELARRRLKLKSASIELDTTLFRVPGDVSVQLDMF